MLKLKVCLWITGLFSLTLFTALAQPAPSPDSARTFRFKFDPGTPLIYSVDIKSRTVNDTRSVSRSSLTRNTVDTRYKIRLTTSGTNQDGTIAVYFEPFDYEQDISSVGPSGQMDTSIRGLDIVGKQNGIVMIDTKRGIGMGQAQSMKIPIYPHLLNGYFDFDAAGNIRKCEGDLPFIDTWQSILKTNINIFSLVFSTNAIDVHDTWTNYVSLKSITGLVFDGDGIIQPWVFTRDLDQYSTNGTVASLSLYESDNSKDLTGYVEQYGQQTSIAIPEHTESMNGTYQFNLKSGCLLSMKKTDSSHDTMNSVIQGNSTEMRIDCDVDSTTQLVSP